MKHVFIINPVSGHGNYQEVIKWVEKHFDKNDFAIHITKYQGHAKEIAASYDKDVILYSVGGDGTAFEVVNGMNLENEFAVIPVGTGNDFFKMINYKKDIISLLEDTVFKGVVTPVDLGQANEHLFLNCMNIGVDADVNARANELKNKLMIPRSMIYMAAALEEVIKMKPVHLEIINPKFQYKKDISLLSVMNGRYYGSTFKSAPQALINDGLLDVCIVDGIGRLRAATLIPKYQKGKHEDLDIVEFKRITELEIKSDKIVNIGCDGEVFQTDHVKIKIHQGALKYRLPQGVQL